MSLFTFLNWKILQQEILSSFSIKKRSVCGPEITTVLVRAIIYLGVNIYWISATKILLRIDSVFILFRLHLLMGPFYDFVHRNNAGAPCTLFKLTAKLSYLLHKDLNAIKRPTEFLHHFWSTFVLLAHGFVFDLHLDVMKSLCLRYQILWSKLSTSLSWILYLWM